MGDAHTTTASAVDRFRERLIDLARKKGVQGQDTAVRWNVRHGERDLKALSGKRLAERTRKAVTSYLEPLERIRGTRGRSFPFARKDRRTNAEIPEPTQHKTLRSMIKNLSHLNRADSSSVCRAASRRT
ncbi:hypothetical protein ThimaDRAFT_3523 [Thiocapsa marina 5811]|uniref:Uncharacterized protein n=1 Tax=Thiocapsa marina 5811 TaxID=768671 RepID=F9UF20_9GAMM|nr:hypothetical protein ThimaDRAFT_3523 [Thiocapsa marina 5811]